MTVVDLHDPTTWPAALLERLTARDDEPDVWGPATPELAGQPLRLFHYTRLTDEEIDNVKTHGIRPASRELALERINRAHASGYITDNQADIARRKNQGHHPNRKGQVWLTTTKDARGWGRIRSGIQPLISQWGGEIIHDAGAKITIGTPTVIEATPPADLFNRVSPSYELGFWRAIHPSDDTPGVTCYLDNNTAIQPHHIRKFHQPGSDHFNQWLPWV